MARSSSFRRLTALISQPLILAQGVTSVYGVLGTLVAANQMVSREFLVFTLLTLVQGISLGVLRSVVGEPSLLVMRTDPTARPRSRHALAAIVVGMPAYCAIIYFSTELSLVRALIISLVMSVPLLHDFTRYRAIGVKRFDLVLASDVTRLIGVLIVCAGTALPAAPPNALIMQSALLLAALPAAAVPLVAPRVREPSDAPYVKFRPVAKWSLAEFAVSQVHTTAPILILSTLGSGSVVAAFRLAQTLMGPVNLLFVAFSSNFLAHSAVSHDSDEDLIESGRKTARAVGATSTSAVFIAVLVVAFGPDLFSATPRSELVLAMVCVGAWTATAASGSIHTVTMRALFYQRRITSLRGGNVLLTWSGFVVGFVLNGVEGSLIAGFCVGALANPLSMNFAAARTYRKHRSKSSPSMPQAQASL